MNISIIRFILGSILKLQAGFLLLPALAAFIYKESIFSIYLSVSALCLIIGIAATIKKPVNNVFYLKDGCAATALSWIILSLFGSLPFYLSGEIPSFTDAFFETVSGFTTTGSSILSDITVLSHGSLLWRCFTNWIGGMGVLVFLLAVIPLSGGSNYNLMKAESPGPSVGKFVPKLRYTARILYLIYIVMSLILFLLLLFGKMPVFDSLCLTFATGGTGGFAILNDSFASYSPYILWVVGIFMILFGINFNIYYLLLLHKAKKAFQTEELHWYLITVTVSTFLITVNLYRSDLAFFDSLTHAFFQVSTIISTCGFSSMDFNLWHENSKMILLLLMFSGACAGSTSGGMKISRILLLLKTVKKELISYCHPKSIKIIKMDQKPVEEEILRSCHAYYITYIVIISASIFLLSFDNKDFTTTFTSVVACFNNIGPGFAQVGPMENFGHFSILSKLVLCFNMLAGRLELFPLLMLFYPGIWKDTLKKLKKNGA